MPAENRTAAIVLNSPVLGRNIEEDFIICADGGVNHAVGSFVPNAVVGDFDSAKGNTEKYERVVCPAIKDYTDGERAIEYAKEKGFSRIAIYGAEGGRSDHVYANFALAAFADELGMDAVIRTASADVYFSGKDGNKWRLKMTPGQNISVLPFGEEITLDASKGLLYPYDNLTIKKSRSGRGISDVATEADVEFTVKKGKALIFISLEI